MSIEDDAPQDIYPNAVQVPERYAGGMAKMASGMLGNRIRPQTTRERLLERKTAVERHLADINAAIKVLDANPGAEEVMNALNRVGI